MIKVNVIIRILRVIWVRSKITKRWVCPAGAQLLFVLLLRLSLPSTKKFLKGKIVFIIIRVIIVVMIFVGNTGWVDGWVNGCM